MKQKFSLWLFSGFVLMLCLVNTAGAAPTTAPDQASLIKEAQTFMTNTEKELLRLSINQSRQEWVGNTYITDDTEILSAQAEEIMMEFLSKASKEAARFDNLPLSEDLRRKFLLLKLATPLPAPSDPAKRAELAQIAASMESTYGKGKYCPAGKKECLEIGDLSDILGKSRNYDELLDAWQGWHKISPPLRPKYVRYVELANEGAKELGFKHLGELWNSGYDMTPEEFQKEVDRLWLQLKPFYNELHCYVRSRLQKVYGADKVPSGKPIPAHILGNMWAQEWNNLYDLLAPEKEEQSFDLTKVLEERKTTAVDMVRYAENFFVSLGLPALPETFWTRSMLEKPRDRDVVCHASAWNIDGQDDIRIKMCIKTNDEDFTTIHHELGHNYYQRAYKAQSPLFENSANDGFHEALGDTISLSVTPAYLVKLNMMKSLPPDNLNPLMKKAIEKIAFLPFGLIMDRWRWEVFSGQTKPEDYNKAWWALREKYQGVAAPITRTEADFDPGAKYHIPANVPYTRYFLASILQFQFHRALCKQAGQTGPLHTCSIYGNKEVGKNLEAMMAMGASRPWPEALKALTGETKMDATAMVDYFAPLQAWLKEQNKNQTCGW
jgi:peptidyl-dipeptidase A